MPAIPEWLPRLPGIIADFEYLSTMILDAEIVAHVFRVTPRHARRLLRELGARQTDRGLAADRLQVLGQLRGFLNDYQIEEERKARLMADLEKARRFAPARKVKIIPLPDDDEMMVSDLPSIGIHLRPGELRIDFRGQQELLSRLLALSKVIANDSAEFEARCEEPAAKTRAAG